MYSSTHKEAKGECGETPTNLPAKKTQQEIEMKVWVGVCLCLAVLRVLS